MSSMSYQGYSQDTIDLTQGHLECALNALQLPEPDLVAFLAASERAWEASQALDPDRDPRVTAETYHGVDDGAWDELTSAQEGIAYIAHVRGLAPLDVNTAKYSDAVDGIASFVEWAEDDEEEPVHVEFAPDAMDEDGMLAGDGGPAFVAYVVRRAVSAVDQCLSCCR
jgi:hypothetical protein